MTSWRDMLTMLRWVRNASDATAAKTTSSTIAAAKSRSARLKRCSRAGCGCGVAVTVSVNAAAPAARPRQSMPAACANTASGRNASRPNVGDDPAVAHDEQPVGHAEHLRHFRGDQQHRHAAVGKVADHPVDFDLGGDVDAARRLVEDEKLDVLDQQPLRQHDLLLVAAGKLAHRLRRIGKPDRQFADLVADQLPASRSVDDAVRRVAGKARQPRIVDDAGVERQPVALAVLGQHGDVGAHCLRRRARNRRRRRSAAPSRRRRASRRRSPWRSRCGRCRPGRTCRRSRRRAR